MAVQSASPQSARPTAGRSLPDAVFLTEAAIPPQQDPGQADKQTDYVRMSGVYHGLSHLLYMSPHLAAQVLRARNSTLC